MRAVIVFESLFGNTELLAGLVRNGLQCADCEVELIEVGTALSEQVDLSRYDLLVVAAPTHALSLSRPESRAEAVARGADPRREAVGVREWLSSFEGKLPDRLPLVAVFDTRVNKARHWPGSAAKRASRWLRQDGFDVIERMSFYVDDIAGPLTPGETRRAEEWGLRLCERGLALARPTDGAGNHT